MVEEERDDAYIAYRFSSTTDPMEFLSGLSEELNYWAESIAWYDKDFVQDAIETSKSVTECEHGELTMPGEIKRAYYKSAADFLGHEIAELKKDLYWLLRALYLHKAVVTSTEARRVVLEAVGIVQLVSDKVRYAWEGYYSLLRYCMWEDYIDQLQEMFGRAAPTRFKKEEELTLEDYESAFREISRFVEYLNENRIAFRLEELGATLKAFCQMTSDDAIGFAKNEEQSVKPRISKEEANIRARELLQEDHRLNIRQLAKQIPCSIGLVHSLPVWKAISEARRKQGRLRRPKAVRLNDKMLHVLGQTDDLCRSSLRSKRLTRSKITSKGKRASVLNLDQLDFHTVFTMM